MEDTLVTQDQCGTWVPHGGSTGHFSGVSGERRAGPLSACVWCGWLSVVAKAWVEPVRGVSEIVPPL